MEYYQHRIVKQHGELSIPLLKKHGILSIGFSDFVKPGFIEEHQANDWESVPDVAKALWGEGVRTGHNVRHFLAMSEGDRVVIPTSWGVFNVYEIASNKRMIPADLPSDVLKELKVERKDDLLHVNSKSIDLGFFREVREVARDIQKVGYADNALTRSLNDRWTTRHISNIRESVENALRRFNEREPISIYDEIKKECLEGIRRVIREKVNPNKLEKLIEWYFRHIGASQAYIPAKNEPGKEGDADIVATFEQTGTIIYVQAKHHNGKTDAWAVEQIVNYVNHKEESEGSDGYTRLPWVVSTADDFEDEAVEAAQRSNVRLIAGEELASRLLEAGIHKNMDTIIR